MSNFINFNLIDPRLKLLSDRHDLILKEYLENKSKLKFKNFTKQQQDNIKLNNRGYGINLKTYFSAQNKEDDEKGWHVAALFAVGNPIEENSIQLPILSKTLLEIGLLSVCAINVLDSDISLNWHIDDDYIPGVKLMRVLWGLDISEEPNKQSIIQIRDKMGETETKVFKNNEFYIFHPTLEHRVENNLSTSRSILCIDYITDPDLSLSIFDE